MSASLWEQTRIAVRDRDAKALADIPKKLTTAKPPIPEPVKNAIEALLEFVKGDEKAARRRLITTSKKRPLDPHEKLILGFLLIDEPAKAKKLFSDAGKAKLRDPRIPEGLGITATDQGKVEDGIRLLTRAVQDDPKSWSARYALGMSKAHKGDSAGAREDFEAVAKMRPDYEPAWLGYAAMSIAAGKAAEASRVLGPLLKAAPGREKLMYAYTDCLAAAGDIAKALAVITPLTNASRDPALLFDYVELCIRGGFIEPAKKTLEKAEKIDAKQARLWLLRGKLFELEKPSDLDAAIEAYEKAVKLDKQGGRAKNSLALALMRKPEPKNLKRAAELLAAASKNQNDPAATPALANLALLKLSEGKDADAKKLASTVLSRPGISGSARAQAEKIIKDAD